MTFSEKRKKNGIPTPHFKNLKSLVSPIKSTKTAQRELKLKNLDKSVQKMFKFVVACSLKWFKPMNSVILYHTAANFWPQQAMHSLV